MRIFRYILTSFVFALSILSSAYAQNISVTLNGTELPCRAAPIIENDRVLIPMRDILEPLGYTVTWQAAEQKIIAKQGDTTLQMKVNASYATVDNTTVVLDAPVRIENKVAMVPLRFVAEHSGAAVTWHGKTATVAIRTNTPSAYSISDSIVTIQTNRQQGSGVILSENGKIATNYHVIENASMAQIIFQNGSVYQGQITVTGLNPKGDIAILKIDKHNLSPVRKAAQASLGEAVVTLSSPQGKRNTKTEGKLLEKNGDILSFSAPIKQGSSGGGLFNKNGEWLGMCSAFTKSAYYAIPHQKISAVTENLHIPIQQMKRYVYTPSAPKNVMVSKKGNIASVYWEPIYGADYFHIYYAPSAKGPYKKLQNTALGNDHWLWGFPHALEINAPRETLFIQIETIKDGVSYGMSNPVQVF